jgi:hypothetical protein
MISFRRLLDMQENMYLSFLFKSFDKIAEDVKDWNDEKTNELIQHFKNNLELRNKATEDVIEQAVEVVLRLTFMVYAPKKQDENPV